MTEKPTPSLNLIERMAQRMAKQQSATADSETNDIKTSLRSAEPAPRAETVFVRAEAPPVRAEAPQPIAARARRGPTTVATPESSRAPSDRERSRQVNLDFRVLRQNGMITPDNMASVISNEFRGIKRKLLQKARDPET